MIHEDPQDYAAKVLHDNYGLGENAACDAACDSIRAAAQAKIAEYRLRAADPQISPTERTIIMVRIDTLEKFGKVG